MQRRASTEFRAPVADDGDAESAQTIPVLVVPPSLKFSTHEDDKQVLTLYNPYNDKLHFKILSTAPTYYSVQPSDGILMPQSSLDIIVRIKASQLQSISKSKERQHDKFKIEMFNEARTARGQQIIPVALDSNSAFSSSQTSKSQNHTSNASFAIPSKQQTQSVQVPNRWGNVSLAVRLLPTLLGVCVMAWLTAGVPSTADTITKLWMAFCIGMITMFLQAKFLEQTS